VFVKLIKVYNYIMEYNGIFHYIYIYIYIYIILVLCNNSRRFFNSCVFPNIAAAVRH